MKIFGCIRPRSIPTRAFPYRFACSVRFAGVAAALVLLIGPAAGLAQEQDTVALALACVERSAQEEKSRSECPPGVTPAEGIILNRSGFSDEVYESLLDGLATMATTSLEESARVSAVTYLAAAGGRGRPQPEPGTVDRLSAIYAANQSARVRRALLVWLPTQTEQQAAIELLRRAAMEDRPRDRHDHDSPQYAAINSLMNMGAAGRAAVMQLHSNGVVKNPSARSYLDGLERAGFRHRRQ